MAEGQYLHGAEVLQIDSGSRTITTVSSSVIGIVGTAPDADETAFPLNTPVMIAGSRTEAAKLDKLGNGTGTLPAAIDAILDQAGAVIVVVRVAEGESATGTMANVMGGVNAATGAYEGLFALRGAKSKLGVSPKILLAPGFTHTRLSNALTAVTVTAPGTGYTAAPTVTVTGGNGTGATAHAVLNAQGGVASVIIDNPGTGYTAAPAIAFTGGGGTGAAATASFGSTANPVVAEMVGIADALRAVIIADGPNTNDADAIQYRKDFGSKRIYVVDPKVIVSDENGNNQTDWASPRVAGVIARTDIDLGFWWSPSNQLINGIIGTARLVDYTLGDPSSRANLLNEQQITTIINDDGYRVWGNRTCSADQKWAFLNVVRTADILNESVLTNHRWAVDRGITKNFVDDVMEGVNAYIRHLVSIGAILGGKCWVDKELNSPEEIAAGRVYFDFEFTPVYAAERITFRSHLVNDYISEVFA